MKVRRILFLGILMFLALGLTSIFLYYFEVENDVYLKDLKFACLSEILVKILDALVVYLRAGEESFHPNIDH